MAIFKQQIDPRVLRTLLPCNALHAAGLLSLSAKTYVEDMPAGRILFVGGQSSRWKWYLIAGTVELKSKAGASRQVQGGSPEAQRPLDTLMADLDIATCRGDVRYVKLDTGEIKELLLERQKGNYEIATEEEIEAAMAAIAASAPVETKQNVIKEHENRTVETPTTPLAATPYEPPKIIESAAKEEVATDDVFFTKLNYMFSSGKLEKPALSAATLQTAIAMSNPRITTRTAAELIGKDPALSQYLLRVANSPTYRGETTTNTVSEAVLRLGIDQTRNLIVSVKLRGSFHTRAAALKKVMNALWIHSTKVAAASYVLAQAVNFPDPDRALLAGLLHDIGVIPIINFAATQEKIPDQKKVNHAIQELRSPVGTAMLREWEFEDDFLLAAEGCENLLRDSMPELDLCDIIMLAQVHMEPRFIQKAGLTKIDDIPAYQKLNVGPSDDGLHINVLTSLRQKIDETQLLLMA